MDNEFEIVLQQEGGETKVPARLLAYGFSYKIEVNLDDRPVSFERDEEGGWRVLSLFDHPDNIPAADRNLIQQILEYLEHTFR